MEIRGWGWSILTWRRQRYARIAIRRVFPFHKQTSHNTTRLPHIQKPMNAEPKAQQKCALLLPLRGEPLNTLRQAAQVVLVRNRLKCVYLLTRIPLIKANFTSCYFYAWMKSVCGKDETHGLIKFILSRWYALIKIGKQSMVLFFLSFL